MSRGTAPIVLCDDEDGCPEWSVDWYTATADNWRDLMAGWEYEPHVNPHHALCPQHASGAA